MTLVSVRVGGASVGVGVCRQVRAWVGMYRQERMYRQGECRQVYVALQSSLGSSTFTSTASKDSKIGGAVI